MNKSVYSGPEALKDFLNPWKHHETPLVELPASLNPFLKRGIHIHAKMLNMLPLGNVKSLPAYFMMQDALGDEREINTIIENSSGNTVASLSLAWSCGKDGE